MAGVLAIIAGSDMAAVDASKAANTKRRLRPARKVLDAVIRYLPIRKYPDPQRPGVNHPQDCTATGRTTQEQCKSNWYPSDLSHCTIDICDVTFVTLRSMFKMAVVCCKNATEQDSKLLETFELLALQFFVDTGSLRPCDGNGLRFGTSLLPADKRGARCRKS
jgi:hypothetical protein